MQNYAIQKRHVDEFLIPSPSPPLWSNKQFREAFTTHVKINNVAL